MNVNRLTIESFYDRGDNVNKLEFDYLSALTQILVRRRQEAQDWQILSREAEARALKKLAVFFAKVAVDDLNRAREAHDLLQAYRYDVESMTET